MVMFAGQQEDPMAAFMVGEEEDQKWASDTAQSDPMSAFMGQTETPQQPPVDYTGPLGLPRTSPITERTGELPERRDQRLEQDRQNRIAKIQRSLRDGEFDPSDTFGDGEKDFLLLADMSRNREWESAKKKFEKKYPEGDFRRLSLPDGGSVELARKGPDDPYREVSWAPGVVGGVASATMLGGMVGSLGGPLGTAVGTAAGSLLDETIENWRGYSRDRTMAKKGISATIEGVVAGAVDTATRRALRISGLAPKQVDAVSAVDASARIARESLERFGSPVEPLAVGQVAGPFGRGMFLQVGATAGKVEKTIGKQSRSLYNFFKSNAEDVPVDALSDDALALIARHHKTQLNDIKTPQQVKRAEAGDTLIEGADIWRQTTRELRDRQYEDVGRLARELDIRFDLSETQNLANDIARGTLSRGIDGEPVRASRGLHGELRRVVEDIQAIDPNVGQLSAEGGEFTSVQQVAALRSRLFDLKEAAMAQSDSHTYREANRLWSSLTKTMDNPVGEGTEEFTLAYSQARNTHKEMEDVLKQTWARRLFREKGMPPESIAKMYANPNHSTELRAIKGILPTESWRKFRDLMRADLMHSLEPKAALNRLDRFVRQDPDSLRLLMTETEEQSVRNYLNLATRIQSAPYQRAMQRVRGDMDRSLDILNRSSKSDIEEFIELAGGAKSEQAQTLRAAVYKDIFDHAQDTHREFGDVLDGGQVRDRIQFWKKSGKLDGFFTQKDWDIISDLQLYGHVISESADIGGGMMAGSVRQKGADASIDILTGKFGRVGGMVARPLFQNDVMAHILSRPVIRNNYNPLTKSQERRLRRLVIAGNMAINDIEVEEDSPETP